MTRDHAERVLQALHAAQAAFYAGEGGEAVFRELLTEDVRWHVPGRNAIAGTHEGIDAVLAYFARRRKLAARSFRMHPGDLLVGDGDHVAALTDGRPRSRVSSTTGRPSGSTGSTPRGSPRSGCCR